MARQMARPMGTSRRRALIVAFLAAALASGAIRAVYAADVAAHGVPLAASGNNRGAYEAALATYGDSLALAWYDTRDGYAQIFVRFIDGTHNPSSEIQLTRGKRYAYEPSLQLTADRLIAAWYDKAPGEPEMTVHVAAWTRAGKPLWQRRLSVTGHHGRNPVIRVSADKIFCAWLEASRVKQQPSVWVTWLDLDGHSLVAPKRVAPASRDTWNLNAAVDHNGHAWVVFDAHLATKRSELYLLRADVTSSAVTRISDDDGAASVYPDIALAGENVALTWFDYRDGNSEVYLIAGPREWMLTASTVDARSRRVTETRGNSIGAYITWNHDRGGLAWCDDTEGQYDVFFQPFDRNGEALSPAQRLSTSTEWSLIPAIAPWRGGFALAWNEYQPARKATKTRAQSEVVFDWVPGLPMTASDH
jgi:hypothetical protein